MTGHGDHSDLWDYYEGLREDLGRAEERIHALEDRIHALEDRQPGYAAVPGTPYAPGCTGGGTGAS